MNVWRVHRVSSADPRRELHRPLEIGPIYPFVGWEIWMFLACVLFCIALTVWKIRSESAHYAEKVRSLKETGELSRILRANPAGDTRDERADGKS